MCAFIMRMFCVRIRMDDSSCRTPLLPLPPALADVVSPAAPSKERHNEERRRRGAHGRDAAGAGDQAHPCRHGVMCAASWRSTPALPSASWAMRAPGPMRSSARTTRSCQAALDAGNPRQTSTTEAPDRGGAAWAHGRAQGWHGSRARGWEHTTEGDSDADSRSALLSGWESLSSEIPTRGR